MWRTLQGLRSLPQRHPFTAFALHQSRPELEITRDFWAEVTGDVVLLMDLSLYDVPVTRDQSMEVPFTVEEMQAALAVVVTRSRWGDLRCLKTPRFNSAMLFARYLQ